ncbi:MAG: cyclic nucleotide-binding domain-containing protein [Acidobacteria bacterium]|nr:cyclic nucleotide-binding domain-containing protein [Acidobacteriota bacterium]
MSGNIFSQYTLTFEEGELVYSQNEPGNSMFVITDGKVELSKQKGDQAEVMAELGKGDFFGELSILEHVARTETAKALTPCSLVVIHRGTFVKMLKSNMEIAFRMMQKFSTKLRQAEEKVDQLLIAVNSFESETQKTRPGIVVPKEKKVVGKLVSLATNRVFILDSDDNLVGRYDPVTGIKPEVDLTYEDENRSVSRRHAMIFRRDNRFYVGEEIGVLNGTFVNGNKASQGGEQLEVNDQDTINFGMLAFKFYLVKDE